MTFSRHEDSKARRTTKANLFVSSSLCGKEDYSSLPINYTWLGKKLATLQSGFFPPLYQSCSPGILLPELLYFSLERGFVPLKDGQCFEVL